MSKSPNTVATDPTPPEPAGAPLRRRGVVAGAGVLAASAAAVALLPSGVQETPAQPPGTSPTAPQGGGYQLTAHVQQYYDTARV